MTSTRDSRISLIENDDLVSSRRKSYFPLCKRFDLVSDDVDTAIVSACCFGGTSNAGRRAEEREMSPSRKLLSPRQDQPPGRRGTHRSSDALSSNTPSLYASPSRACARQCILVVLPIPGIPYHQSLSQNAFPPSVHLHYLPLPSYLLPSCPHSLVCPDRTKTHRYDDMRHIAILRYDFQSVNCIGITDYIVQHLRTVFLDPIVSSPSIALLLARRTMASHTPPRPHVLLSTRHGLTKTPWPS